ncbi:TRAP transporter small permease [uncultured Cohaesibacter sp.]|uniref:TRAP transporter small permease n=1 Tax=uncultured Cohaesibacter sp. TaxID=1002546 RepID=UPI0029C9061B|nr:TRAP transporter small permease [uncultured Cohaesibacter sp.]
MQNQLKTIAGLMGSLSTAALWLASLGLVMMTAFTAAQVFVRYVLNDSIVWSEPVSIVLMAWFIFLGAAVGIREGNHLSFDVLLIFVPDTVKTLFYTLSDIVVIAFGAGMIWYGGELMNAGWHIKIPTLGLPRAIDYMPLVVGGVLVVLFSLERLARRAAGLPTARFGETDIEE